MRWRRSKLLLAGMCTVTGLLQTWSIAACAAEIASKGAKKTSPSTNQSASSGVFTRAQASRGGKRFDQVCAACHRREDIKPKWLHDPTQKTVGDLYEKISTTMPNGKPGSLSPKEYADIVAFVLKVKEFPPGDKELPSDIDALRRVKLSDK